MDPSFANVSREGKSLLQAQRQAPPTTTKSNLTPSSVQEASTIEITLPEETLADVDYLSQVLPVGRFNGLWP